MEGSAPGTLSPWGKSIILFSRGVTALFFVSVEEERVYIARIVTFTTLIDRFTSVMRPRHTAFSQPTYKIQ